MGSNQAFHLMGPHTYNTSRYHSLRTSSQLWKGCGSIIKGWECALSPECLQLGQIEWRSAFHPMLWVSQRVSDLINENNIYLDQYSDYCQFPVITMKKYENFLKLMTIGLWHKQRSDISSSI